MPAHYPLNQMAEKMTDAPPPPSLPGLTRQPALQRQGAGCRVKLGNDGEASLSVYG